MRKGRDVQKAQRYVLGVSCLCTRASWRSERASPSRLLPKQIAKDIKPAEKKKKPQTTAWLRSPLPYKHFSVIPGHKTMSMCRRANPGLSGDRGLCVYACVCACVQLRVMRMCGKAWQWCWGRQVTAPQTVLQHEKHFTRTQKWEGGRGQRGSSQPQGQMLTKFVCCW